MSFFGEDESSTSAEEDVRQTFGGREASLLIVDCNEGTLKEFETSNGERLSLFSIVMRGVYEQMRGELEANSSDLFGLILYGTARSSSEITSFKHVYTLLPLEQPSIDRLTELSRLSDSFDRAAFDEKFGGLASATDNVELADVFWEAQNAFANCRTRLSARRAFLATNEPEPTRALQTRISSFRRALTKATDLLESRIELIPLTLLPPTSSHNQTFDISQFFEKLSLDETHLHAARHPSTNVADVVALLRRKSTQKRAYCRLEVEMFGIGGSHAITFSAGCYAPIRPARIPQRQRVDRQTNELVQVRKRLYVPAGERERVMASSAASTNAANAASIPKESDILLPQVDVRRAVTYADRRIVFDREELASLHNFGEPRLRILTFVPVTSEKLFHYVRAPLFLYPDDDRVLGSTPFFTALLASCLRQEVVAIGVFVPRRGVAPRLVALLPQRERFVEDFLDASSSNAKSQRTQLQASGFVVAFRPFVDDVRKFDLTFSTSSGAGNVQERASLGQIAAARNLVDALLDKRFTVRDVHNPAIATHYASLEAVALDLAERRVVQDQTLPDREEFDSVAQQLEEFEASVFSEPTASTAASGRAKKRPAAAAANSAANGGTQSKAPRTTAPEDVDWQAEAQNGNLSKYTIPQLKEAIKKFQIRSGGSKKQDLVDAIENHFMRT